MSPPAEPSSRFKDLISVRTLPPSPKMIPHPQKPKPKLTPPQLLTTIKGDLSSTLSPPFLLAPKSMTELPTCWIERPSLFAAPALEPDPARRALLVLKWFVVSLRALLYVGEGSKLGMKKPLNPFLGEVCVGCCVDEGARVALVVEQVSHHPPVGACYFWDEEHGIQCEGFSKVQMTFNGSINVKQVGRSVLHIDKYDEYYSIPILDAKVVGFFSGHLYPELAGKYSIVSSSGYISEMEFCGKGFWTGEKNSVSAKVYHRDTGPELPLYTLSGQWSSKFEIRDCGNDAFHEIYDLSTATPVPMTIPQKQSKTRGRRERRGGKSTKL
ncbi:hypothetical protein G7Y79_00004g014760 [Physcia stellaris]|nr:hypothetical protein G7Y79_00004g014760 [Physcia stellaris]